MSIMDNSNMVPQVAGGFNRLSSQATISERFANSSTQQLSASNEQEKVISDRLLCIRRYLQKKGVSKEASNIIAKSWRNSTAKQYQYPWKAWMHWLVNNMLIQVPRYLLSSKGGTFNTVECASVGTNIQGRFE